MHRLKAVGPLPLIVNQKINAEYFSERLKTTFRFRHLRLAPSKRVTIVVLSFIASNALW